MRTIKKYSNRRLYDTEQSRYLNLEELARIVIAGEDVEVVDASTGADLTRPVLLQVLLEIQGGARLFPPGLLHRIIRFGGDHPLQRAALQQLGAGLELLDAQLSQLERTLGFYDARATAAAPPSGAQADPREPWTVGEREIRYGERHAASSAPDDAPSSRDAAPPPDPPPASPGAATGSDPDDELAVLRARLAALEERLDR